MTFHIPPADEIDPLPRMSDKARSAAMNHILFECFGNYSDRVGIETALRLRYSIVEIGSKYFFSALDEARANQRVTP